MTPPYAKLDRPDIVSAIFHPRPQSLSTAGSDTISDHLIPVDDATRIGARFHVGTKSGANLLFFHGNGEIAADYDDLGPIYGGMQVNLLAVDYRGYGLSEGSPTVSTMMSDCHRILDYVLSWLSEQGHTGPFLVMGRSLGSASALELAAEYQDRIDGLIIESGFAYAAPLLQLLGVNIADLQMEQDDGFDNLSKIRSCRMPSLIIHAEFDHIIPYSDGRALFNACGAEDKQLLKIDHANHNDILMRGFKPYMQAVADLIQRIALKKPMA